jgi:GNAT superfamily N-acetyltransferase
MTTNGQVTVGLLETVASRDADLVEQLARLVNDVYATAESGLWREGATRTTASEVAELIRAEQIAVATRNGHIVGSIRIHEVSEDASEFGMLVSAAEERGTGVGRALLDYAERYSRELGLRAIRAELLVPREWSHPSKEFLDAWYRRSGYGAIRTDRIDDNYPHLAPLLATPCDLVIYQKPLR